MHSHNAAATTTTTAAWSHSAPTPAPTAAHMQHQQHLQHHQPHPHHPQPFDHVDMSGSIPSWPPPYPIDTTTPAFNAPQPGLTQRSYFDPADQTTQPVKGSSAPSKRQRISRACDKCNQLRTKCDGKEPCAHCVEFQQQCTYDRIKKKRGKVPKSQQQQKQDDQSQAADGQDEDTTPPALPQFTEPPIPLQPLPVTASRPEDEDNSFEYPEAKRLRYNSHSDAASVHADPAITTQATQENGDMNATAFVQPQIGYNYTAESVPSTHSNSQPAWPMPQVTDDLTRWSPAYSSPSVMNDHSAMFNFSLEDLQVAYADQIGTQLNDPSILGPSPTLVHQQPAFQIQQPVQAQQIEKPVESTDQDKVKYPILEPLIPHLRGVIPNWLACRLLEEYFTCAPYDSFHPRSPYIFNYFHRKSTFLSERPTSRKRSRSLLASMLWLAARTCDIPYFTSDTTTRPRTCKKLLEMTIQLLVINPFLHHSGASQIDSVVDQMHLAQGRSVEDKLEEMKCTTSQTIGLDEIITQVHIATVVSASESKKESIRWWNAAWNLARELQLGRELTPAVKEQHQTSDSTQFSDGQSGSKSAADENTFEEEREERRRAWWLLYLMDRHLSLCYNKPLFLLQRECLTLLHPLDDVSFQCGRYATGADRLRGQPVHFTGTSVFQFFLPLMAMLGDILELHELRTRPLWGNTPSENSDLCERRVRIIQKQLDEFQISATAFQTKMLSGKKDTKKFTNQEHELQVAVAYGRYISNVLHVLIWGKWDPINLLANEEWLSSDEGRHASEHAVKAAEHIAEVLGLDPDLSFMPYFLGIQLLQGSFLLLVLADKHQTEARSELVNACEIMVRAHEACVVTLDTEYQRNFRKIMRSALAEVRGRVTEETKCEQQKRRREVLGLYRWTDDGRGIAL